VVTGAGQGLGAAIVRKFAELDARVAVTDINHDQAVATAAEVGSNAVGFELDVSDPMSVERAVSKIESELGPTAVLVNNAGINLVGPSERLSLDRWRRVLAVNIDGVFFCCRAFGALMLSRRAGSIVNIASANAELGAPGRAAYCASKSAVVGLTRSLGVEWASRGVRVNAVEPGYILSPLLSHCFDTGLIQREMLVDRIPSGRLGNPSEVAHAVAFLASTEASYLTGHVLPVDGGYMAYGSPGPASQIPLLDIDL
jgi:NAD(P)-dependent dehydrogenase (short-subunit alcohol dehydrogenase family)